MEQREFPLNVLISKYADVENPTEVVFCLLQVITFITLCSNTPPWGQQRDHGNHF